ncbi:MAG: tyrosine-type recombinase/integrase [Leptospirales bacterium]
MDRVLSFTKTSVEKVIPTGKRERFRDEKVPGLYLEIMPSGAKVFRWIKWIDRKMESVRIGPFPSVQPEDARRRAEDLNTQTALGLNPAKEKRKKRDALTFGELFESWLYEAKVRGKKTWQADERRYQNHLDGLSNTSPGEIPREDIKRIHSKVRNGSGLYEANRTLALARTVLAWGIREYNWPFQNPAAGIRLFKEEKRDRWLEPHEIPVFFAAVNAEPNPEIRDFVLVALFTGARRSNVLQMAWKDLDLENGRWRIPETKAGEPQVVPLHGAALEILKARRETVAGFFVFPGTGKTGHLAEPKKGWARILERAGIENLRIHDLRRTLGSWLATQGESLLMIGRMLGHKSQGSTAVYSRISIDPVRAAMTKAIDGMIEAGKKPSNVVPIPKETCK